MVAIAPQISRYCTGSIVTIEQTAQELSAEGGGLIECTASEQSFPREIRHWCAGSGSELVDVSSISGTYRAKLRVPGRRDPDTPDATLEDELRIHGSSARALLDCRGLRRPAPIDKLTQRARLLPKGAELDILSDDPELRPDLQTWCQDSGSTVVVGPATRQWRGPHPCPIGQPRSDARTSSSPHPVPKIDARAPSADPGPTRREPVAPMPESNCRILVSTDDDRALTKALEVATKAAATGMDASVLFTLQSLEVLRASRPQRPQGEGSSWPRRLRTWISPRTPRLALETPRRSTPVARLMSMAERKGVKFVVCTQSMALMGITRSDLERRSNLGFSPIAPFLSAASQAELSRVF